MWRPTIPHSATLERILLLVIAGIAQIYAYNTCPEDVPGDTARCLEQYNSQVDALTSSGHNFYTGVDVEQLRLVCRYLRDSARCANNIKQSCPDTEHADIETILSEHISIGEMCFSDPNFFEVYARNQFCFMRLSASSETCYNVFRSKAEPEIRNIYVGDQSTLNKYCSYFDKFVECIKGRVRTNCNAEASDLVETLVRPSVRLSAHCKNDTARATTASPNVTKKPPRERSGNEAYSKQTVSGVEQTTFGGWVIVAGMAAALTLIR